jgi:ribosomal protein S18 acetylase RimI-like enzyme
MNFKLTEMELVSSPYQVHLTDSKNDYEQIILLNELNNIEKVDKDLWASEGFLSLKFSNEQLDLFRGPFKHVVAKVNDKIIGYALVLLKENKFASPFFDPMFDIINSTDMEGKLLKDINYFVMAQICVDKQFRGIGVFKALYYTLADQMGSSFEKVIIEVSPNNIKSMFAHQNIGFEVINTVKNKEGVVDWNVMSWDMN